MNELKNIDFVFIISIQLADQFQFSILNWRDVTTKGHKNISLLLFRNQKLSFLLPVNDFTLFG